MRHRLWGSRSNIGADSLSFESGSEQARNDYLNQEVSSWTAMAAAGAAFGLLFLLEWVRPLRQVESKIRRTGRNLAVAGISAAALQLAERPVSLSLARRVHRGRWGLFHHSNLRLPWGWERWLNYLVVTPRNGNCPDAVAALSARCF